MAVPQRWKRTPYTTLMKETAARRCYGDWILAAGPSRGVNGAGRVESGNAFDVMDGQGSSSQGILMCCEAKICHSAQHDHTTSDETRLRESAFDFGC